MIDLNPGGSGVGRAGSGEGGRGGGAKSRSALKYKCNVCEHYTRGSKRNTKVCDKNPTNFFTNDGCIAFEDSEY